MSEATRQRAQFSTRLSGVTATVLVAAAAAYVLLAGFGAPVPGGVRRPMAVITLTPPPPEEAPRPKFKDDALKDLQFGPEPRPQELPDIFEPDRQTAAEDSGLNVEPIGDGVVPPPHTPVNLAPRMKPMAPPPYPLPEIRANAQGTTTLEVCIDARGRVTSAKLAQSSGHARLDEAALIWVRDARFAPGLVDGVAQPVCGHPVDYVWRLESLRR